MKRAYLDNSSSEDGEDVYGYLILSAFVVSHGELDKTQHLRGTPSEVNRDEVSNPNEGNVNEDFRSECNKPLVMMMCSLLHDFTYRFS